MSIAYRKMRVKEVSRESSKFDVWLLRISHVSQFGLFLFTVGTIYFTVIPLYQKALLDEAIAKKEIELKEANASLEKVYSRMRSSVIGQYVFYAGADCSGLMIPSKNADLIPKDLVEKNNISRTDRPHVDTVFDIDVGACLLDVAERSTVLQELRHEDRKLLDEKLVAIGKELIPVRQGAISEYKKIPSGVSKNLNSLWARLRIEKAYREAILNKITTIKNIEWNKNHQSQ